MQTSTPTQKKLLSKTQLREKILIIAGETSGDQHGADLVKSLLKKNPHLEISAMGGKNLAQAGAEIIVDSTELSVVGFVEIFKVFNKIRSAFKALKEFIKHEKPKLVILIDYPGFNLRMAKFAKKHGCKVLYYISPQLWAWRESRIKIIKKAVDTMAVIFPFEVGFYEKHGIVAHYVGNPLIHQLPLELSREKARNMLDLLQSATIIGLLPGSRKAEIARMLPIQIEAAKLLLKKNPKLQFVLPIADSLKKSDITPYLDPSLPIKLVENNRFAAIKSCDAVIATSGTVTLETALLGVPLVIAYKGSWISYFIAKKLVKINHIGLCNIVAGKTIAQEFIQHEATPENLSQEIENIMNNQSILQHLVTNNTIIDTFLTPTFKQSSLIECIEKELLDPGFRRDDNKEETEGRLDSHSRFAPSE